MYANYLKYYIKYCFSKPEFMAGNTTLVEVFSLNALSGEGPNILKLLFRCSSISNIDAAFSLTN